MDNIQKQIEVNNRNLRREVFMRRVLHGLRQTVRLRGMKADTPVDDVYVEFTDKSAQYLAPLLEAVDILEAIIFASDGCRGHRECLHSMEPWQRARALLEGKWQADNSAGEREWPEEPR